MLKRAASRADVQPCVVFADVALVPGRSKTHNEQNTQLKCLSVLLHLQMYSHASRLPVWRVLKGAKHTTKVIKRAASPTDVQPCVTVACVALVPGKIETHNEQNTQLKC